MSCLGKTLLWPSPGLAGGQSDSQPCPIPAGFEDPEALEGWKQSQPQYLEPEPLPALPGSTYTAKAVAKSQASCPSPTQPSSQYITRQVALGSSWGGRGLFSREKVSTIPTLIFRTITTADIPSH